MKVVLLLALLGAAAAEIFFEETFSDGDAWESRYTYCNNNVPEIDKHLNF